MKQLYFCLVWFAFVTITQAQDFDNYQPIQAANPIPADFLTRSSEKYQKAVQEIERNTQDSRKIRNQKRDFYLKNSFVIDELLLSGRILFNDPATRYVNQVVDKLLKNQRDLRHQLRFYVVRSKVANAFATDGGIIFVNMGLLAQLENEAQLAFILAHEISHYTKKHSITGYLESQKIYNGKGNYQKLSIDDKFLAKMKYSKELETEADKEGLNLYLQSGYTTDKLTEVFEMLKYADLPFEDKECKLAFLETDGYRFPDDYRLASVKPISLKPEEEDKESTHPNTEKRKIAIGDQLKNHEKAGSLYLVSENEFNKVRKIARFELSHLYLKNLDYVNAIYNSYLLLDENPESRYLHQIISASLIQMAKYANAAKEAAQQSKSNSYRSTNSEEEIYHPTYDYEKVEGASQRLACLFSKMNEQELTTLAVAYAWKIRQKYPESQAIKELSETALRELAFSGVSSLSKFSTTRPAPKPLPGLATSKDSISSAPISKLDKIKKLESEKEYHYYAFVNYLSVPEFTQQFKTYVTEKEAEDKSKKLTTREKLKIRDHHRKYGVSLNVDKVVIVNTDYYKIDDRKRKNKLRFIESEERNLAFNDNIKELAQKVGVKTEWVDPKTLTTSDAEKFNDYAFLRDWISKLSIHDNIELPHLTQEQKKKFVAKYGTPYVCWMGTINLKDKAPVGLFFYSLACPYLLPLAGTKAFTPKQETLYFATVFNVEDEKVYLIDYKVIRAKDADYILNANIYHTFHQIKHQKKK